MSRIAFIVSLLLSVAAAKKLYMCGVVTDVDDSFVSPTIFGDDFSNYNAISFGDFYAPSADVEGAAAIKGDLNLPNGGYSFGALRRVTGPTAIDAPLTASVIVGGNAVYVSGSIQPQTGKDYIYVGGTFTTSDPGLTASRYTGASGNQAAAFDAAQDYYTRVSASYAALPTTIYATRQWSEMRVTCPDASASLWVVSIQAADINQITYWTKTGCSEQAQFIFNVAGTQDVTFSGDNFYHAMELVVWNVLGSGRTVNLGASEVRGTLLAPNNAYAQRNSGVWKGQIIVANVIQAHQINRQFCPKPPTPIPTSDCVTFETQCAGLSFTLGEASSFIEYNAISFGDFNANTGDIEGRLAARGNVNFGEGYSVGATLSTVNDMPDRHQHYSLIVGGDLTWINGALFPNTLGAVIERAYVAGSSSTPASISDRVDSTQSDISGIFDAAKTCYTGYQQTLKAKSDNVQATVADSGLFLTCNDASADSYSVTLAGSLFSTFTYTVTVGCNFQSRWTINVVGSDNVDISGGSFPGIPGATVYNVECTAAGQTVSIHDTQLFGHLLAPNCIVNQPTGVIVGKVVAGSVQASLQINSMTTCPTPQTVTLTLVASQNAVKGSMIVYVKGADSNIRVGDQTSAGKVVGVSGDMVVLNTPLTQDYSAGQVVGTMFVSSTDGRQVIANPTADQDSSSSIVGVAAVAVAAAALLI